MRRNFLVCLAMGLAALLWCAALAGCSGGNGNGDGGPDPDGADGSDGGDDTTITRTISFSSATAVDMEQAGLQLQLRATPDDLFAIAYYQYAATQDVCTFPINGDTETPVERDQIRYAWWDGTAWAHEDVTTFESVMLSGIQLGFDGTTPIIAFLGGQEGRQVCGGSDLMIARRTSPGSWSESAAVDLSNEAAAGGDCPLMQSICDFGDVVGLWPSLATAPDGTIGIAYRDIHNGYTKEAQDASDLEWAFGGGGGWGHEWIDLARGTGLFNSLAFNAAGEPAVASYNGKGGILAFSRKSGGAWNAIDTACACVDGDACNCPAGQVCARQRCITSIDHPEAPLPAESFSLAIGPDNRYLVAFHDPDTRNLMLGQSEDGAVWTRSIIDADGDTGHYPSLAFDPLSGKPIVAYYRCNRYDPSETECDAGQDGVRFAYFNGAYPADLASTPKWKKVVVASDGAAADGLHTSMAVLPDGRVGIAYSYSWVDPATMQTQRYVMFQLGTWEEQ